MMKKNSLKFFITSLIFTLTYSLYSHNKYILTGGPCCGKTTILRELAKRKYQTCPESYSELYKEAKALGTLNDFLPHTIKQRWMLVNKQEEQEAKLDSTKPAFLDRSIPDIFFYATHLNLTLPQDLINRFLLHKDEYKMVFIFEPLPKYLYQKTEVRYESYEEARTIHETLLSQYVTYGFNVCIVPFDTVENRVRFVLNKISAQRS